MDKELKRGLLDICVLRAVKNEPSYGYKIIKDVKEYIEISESTLYPILRRLELANQISLSEDIFNGRTRKYYSITELGLKRLEEFTLDFDKILKMYNYIKGENKDEKAGEKND